MLDSTHYLVQGLRWHVPCQSVACRITSLPTPTVVRGCFGTYSRWQEGVRLSLHPCGAQRPHDEGMWGSVCGMSCRLVWDWLFPRHFPLGSSPWVHLAGRGRPSYPVGSLCCEGLVVPAVMVVVFKRREIMWAWLCSWLFLRTSFSMSNESSCECMRYISH